MGLVRHSLQSIGTGERAAESVPVECESLTQRAAVVVGEIFTYPNTILECNAADGQRLEELGDGFPIWLRVYRSTRRWQLRRCKVRNVGCRLVVELGF